MNYGYTCSTGKPYSADPINSKATLDRINSPEGKQVLSGLGMELATEGKRYRRTVVCPVNGDGYYYTRRHLLDSNGLIVGSTRDASGPAGEL